MSNNSFLSFIPMEHKGVTGKWMVAPSKATRVESYLGEVRWYSPWRRYVFCPFADTVFDASCMKELTSFIESQMALRK